MWKIDLGGRSLLVEWRFIHVPGKRGITVERPNGSSYTYKHLTTCTIYEPSSENDRHILGSGMAKLSVKDQLNKKFAAKESFRRALKQAAGSHIIFQPANHHKPIKIDKLVNVGNLSWDERKALWQWFHHRYDPKPQETAMDLLNEDPAGEMMIDPSE